METVPPNKPLGLQSVHNRVSERGLVSCIPLGRIDRPADGSVTPHRFDTLLLRVANPTCNQETRREEG